MASDQEPRTDALWTVLAELDPGLHVRRARRLVTGSTPTSELRRRAEDRRILITGASSGVGRIAARELAAVGGHVLVVARRQDLLTELVEEIRASGGRADSYACDLSSRDACSALAEAVIADHGGVDILVNNAGRSIRRSLRNSADRLHDFERTMQLNYFGMLWLTTPLVDHMRRRGGCHVINVSTLGTQIHAQPRFSAYLASKSAMDGFARSVAAETRKDRVWWTTVHLPLVRTEMIAPTKSYRKAPALTAAQGADMILDAVRRRPTRVSHPAGLLSLAWDTFSPDTLDAVRSGGFRRTAQDPLPSVGIIGAGVSGLALAMALQKAGSDNFRIYEKSAQIGGTWRDNTYPGLACDVPAHYYTFKDHPNPNWSRLFSPGPEIQKYLLDVVAKTGLEPTIAFNQECVAAEFADQQWRLSFADGSTAHVDVLVCATGVLHHPKTPAITGLEDFAGPRFHSARWDHSVPLAGRRIGVIGTGSTGVQITSALAEDSQVTLFQRSPHWVAKVPNPAIPAILKWGLRLMPGANQSLYAVNRKFFDTLALAVTQPGWQRRSFELVTRRSLDGVKDPDLREELRPPDLAGCKRLIMSPGFYDVVQSANVSVVSAGIDHIEPRGVVTDDGVLHELDVLVTATGFDAMAYMRSINLTGRDGVTVEDAWSQGPRAHFTTTMPGFPNMFLMLGPHSPIGNSSIIPISEHQADYIVTWLQRMRRRGIGEVEVKAQALQRYSQELVAAMSDTIWTTGCNSWYLGPDGVPVLWPWTMERFRAEMRRPRWDDFVETPAATPAASDPQREESLPPVAPAAG